jgi:hypothetical protein
MSAGKEQLRSGEANLTVMGFLPTFVACCEQAWRKIAALSLLGLTWQSVRRIHAASRKLFGRPFVMDTIGTRHLPDLGGFRILQGG